MLRSQSLISLNLCQSKIMKNLLIPFILIFGSADGFGQYFVLEDFKKTSVSAEWSINNGNIRIYGTNDPKGLEDGLVELEFKQVKAEDDYFIPFQFYYLNGDIVIDYLLRKRQNSRLFSVVRIDEVRINGESVKPWQNELIGDVDTVSVNFSHDGHHQIIWDNAFENYIYKPEGELTITLSAGLIEKTPRELYKKPEFAFKQKWPHLTGMSVGAGLALAGYLIRRDADDIYNDDYKTQFFRSLAEPYYESANEKRHKSILLTYSGGGLVLINAVWLTSKWLRYRADQNINLKYYQNKNWDVSVTPSVMPLDNGALYAGFHLNCTF